jgi:tryptophan halogenase
LWVGLSAAFAEPLEATSIHSTIIQLHSFVFKYLRDNIEDTCNPASIKIYNKKMSKMYDDFKDFLNIHYATQRDDSEFWRWMKTGETMTESSKQILELQKSRLLRGDDLDQYYGHAGSALYNWVLAGLGYISKKEAEKDLLFAGQAELAQTVWSVNQNSFENMSKSMIDNTEFVRNVRNYNYGYSLS